MMEVYAVSAKEHLNAKIPGRGHTAIHLAALHDHSRICHVLAAQVSIITCRELSKLHNIISPFHFRRVDFQSNVDINVETAESATALHLAAERGHWSVVECLVGWGAAVNMSDARGNTPMHIVASNKRETIPESPHLRKVKILQLPFETHSTCVCR